MKSVMDIHGRIDVLVNSTGFARCGPVEYLTRSDVRAEFEVNMFAPFQLASLLAPVMRTQGGGRIIHISSINCTLAFPIGSLYSAAKSARQYIPRVDNPYRPYIERAEHLLRQHRKVVVPASRVAKTISGPRLRRDRGCVTW